MLKVEMPNNRQQLRQLIRKEMQAKGKRCSLNHIDVRQVTDMAYMFADLPFMGGISQWNTSHVTDMVAMFNASPFNGDISQWDTGRVQNMSRMFYESSFNGDISKWNVSKVINMSAMFHSGRFNGDVSAWNVANLKHLEVMFEESPFSGGLKSWQMSERQLETMFGRGYTEYQQKRKIIEESDVLRNTFACPEIRASKVKTL